MKAMASGTPIQCGPCLGRNVKSNTDIWCINCAEGLCSTCSKHHRTSKPSRDHKTINIDTYRNNLSTRTKYDKQSFDCLSHSINNIAVNIELKERISIDCISDMICLVDGRVVVVESFGNVSLYTNDAKLQKELSISGEAFSVTQIDQDTFAISYPNEKSIKIYNLKNETVTKVIKLDKACHGISFSNHCLAVNLYFNDSDEICIIDLEGNTLKSIEVPIDKYLEYLVYCNDRVIFSVFDKAVYCYDVSGKQIWEYQNDLRGPRGLCTDTYGNVFVIDYMSDRMIVISKNGKHSKVLISEEDELDNKKCICLNQSDSSGFICDIDGTYLAKFNLSYE